MKLKPWVKLPTRWIEAGGLAAFSWKEEASAGTSALMVLPVIAHHADAKTGVATITYDTLCAATGLSRTKVAHGLAVLDGFGVLERAVGGRSDYRLSGFDPEKGWAKLPARGLYAGEAIAAFKDFHLRRKSELDALKVYLAIVARRDNHANRAYLTYGKLEAYAGIPRPRIKTAISLLVTNGLIYVEHLPSTVNEHGVAGAYRPTHLDSYVHAGTRGRSEPAAKEPALDEAIDV